jgi:AcrR family transcriptional regulator
MPSKTTAIEAHSSTAEPQTEKGRRTRQAFQDAAREVISRQGYARATIGDIAAAADRSPGSFYNYFDSTSQLLQTLAEEFRDEVLERISDLEVDTSSLEDVLRELVRAYWTTYRDHSADLAGVFQASMMDPEFAEAWKEIRADGRQAIANSVRWAQELGYCEGLDPETTGSALGAMMDYFCYVWLVGGGELGRPECDEDLAIETLTQLWLRALLWVEPSETVTVDGANRPTGT